MLLPEDQERFEPQPGPQTEFIRICGEVDITVYGGQAGGGKTYAELIQPTKHIKNRRFGGVIFRRQLTDVKKEGAIWDESCNLYPLLGAVPNKTELHWTFPSGCKFSFSHIEHEKDLEKWKGAQLGFCGFDELTTFTSRMFWYMFSRLRSMSGIKPYVFATTNPGANWVFVLLAPWVDPKFPNPAKSGEVRWFIRPQNKIIWVPQGTPKALSITFIRATLDDNKKLTEANPEYRDRLEALPEEDKRALLHGEWGVKPAHRVVSAFDETKHKKPYRSVDTSKWALCYVGADFGLINDAQIIGKRETTDSALVITKECWLGVERTYPEMAENLREMADGSAITDGTGGNRNTERGERQALRKEGIPLRDPDKDLTSPVLQYKNLNRCFRENLIFVSDECEELIEQLNNFERKKDANGDPTDEFDDSDMHLLCALRYLATLVFPPAIEEAPPSTPPAGRIAGVTRSK
jgi:hypothetical protein